MTWKDDLLDRYTPTIWPQIACGEGWRPLVEELYDEVDKYPCVTVAQVKEKYASLRFYISHDWECKDEHEDLRKKIDLVERKSHSICELCGAPGTCRGTNWIRTLCDECDTVAPRPDQA